MTEFTAKLEEWYEQNGRSALPWRSVTDPYLIWISEIILQQTRVEQGKDYYLRFVERFPDVFSLAAAEEDEVLKLWQGLGYYSRARNLHAAARSIAATGHFPDTYEGIRALKGVGDYTAAAIASFAYRLPYAVVDGNVYRVLSRVFGITVPIDSNEGKKVFADKAALLLDRNHPDVWNSAIMDFGAIHCTPKAPSCMFCPFAGECIAFREGNFAEYPVKSKKTKVKDRWLVYVYIEDGKNVLLRRRPEGDIWQGLYEPYLIEFSESPSEMEISRQLSSLGPGARLLASGLKHVLTHRKLWIDCYRLVLETLPDIQGYIKVPLKSRDTYARSRIVDTIFDLVDSSI